MSLTEVSMQQPELLAPAGNLEKLRTALLYGADAVYVGVPGLSLRGTSAEMSLEDLALGVSEAHTQHVRVYAAINTFARKADLDQAARCLPDWAATGVDALIVSDPGLVRLARRRVPQVPLHLSTQSNTTNAEAVRQPKLPVGAPAPRQTSSCGVLKWSMSLTPFHCSGGTLTFSPFTS